MQFSVANSRAGKRIDESGEQAPAAESRLVDQSPKDIWLNGETYGQCRPVYKLRRTTLPIHA